MASKKGADLKRWVLAIARISLGGLLFYAGFTKIGDAHGFSEEISHYKLLPGVLERLVAVTMPWNEIVAGGMLIFGLWQRAAALIAMALFGVFAIAVSAALMRGLDISCGCFGKATISPLGYKTLVLDVVGFALAMIVFFWTSAKKSRR